MNATDRREIESYAWDKTIGAGCAEEFADAGYEPGPTERAELALRLDRKLTLEDAALLRRVWAEHLQAASAP